MGQHLLNPPSVAGRAERKAWITRTYSSRAATSPDVLIPDITGCRDWNFTAGGVDAARTSSR